MQWRALWSGRHHVIGDVSGVIGESLFIPDAKLRAEYPWVGRWPVEDLDIHGRLAALASRDPLRGALAQDPDPAPVGVRGRRSRAAAAPAAQLGLTVAFAAPRMR
jgi:hypothetical protein